MDAGATQQKRDEWKNSLEARRAHYKKIIDEGTLMNDSYSRVFFKDGKCIEVLLQTILKDKELKVIDFELQKDYKNPRGRSVIMDIVTVDVTGEKHDVEIQQDSERASEKRARYYSGALDVNTLNPSEDFDELPKSTVIFITRDDVLGDNLPIYHIHRTIEETEKQFNDGSSIIYVNSKIQDDTELGKLMQDFHCKSADKMHNKVFAERTRLLKETSEGVDIMSKELEEIYEAGQEAATKRALIDVALQMLADGFEPEVVSKYSKMDVEDVKTLARLQMA